MSLPSSPTASLVGKEKLKEVAALVAELRKDLISHHLTNERRKILLEQLKVYGRNPENSDPIFTPNGIETLAKQGFDDKISVEASREALSCLANALLLEASTRQLFADLDIFDRAIERLKSTEYHDEFLVSRILFLETYNHSIDLDKLARENGLAGVLNKKLQSHAARYAAKQGNGSGISQPMADPALTETAKLVFAMTTTRESVPLFSPSIENLFFIVTHDDGTLPLQQPFGPVLSAILNLDSEDKLWKKSAFPEDRPTFVLSAVVNILRSALKHYPEEELNATVSPVVVLLHKLYHSAADAEKSFLRKELLPSDGDRTQALGQSDSLASHLLRLSVSPLAPQLREAISTLLYVMSDSDPDTFVHNVGFGYASGFLLSKGEPLPTTGRVSTDDSGAEINPITGQRRDAEPRVELPNMTDEEKEREAERLFVLFERLKKTGIIDVVNPVERAVEEGRFEEMPD